MTFWYKKSAYYIENESHTIPLLQTHNSQIGIDRSPSYDIPQLPAGRESDIRSVALFRASCFGKTKQKNTKYKIQVLKYKVQILKDRPTLNKRQRYWFSVFNCDVHFSFFYDCKVKATMKFNPKTKNIATQLNIKIHFEVVTNNFLMCSYLPYQIYWRSNTYLKEKRKLQWLLKAGSDFYNICFWSKFNLNKWLNNWSEICK